MKKIETSIPGCFELQPDLFLDERGSFVKPYSAVEFERLGLNLTWYEDFYSHSIAGVIRGMHYQVPRDTEIDYEGHHYPGTKLVYCARGYIRDVVLDLRADSPTFGKFHETALTAQQGNSVYVPYGCAHGFHAVTDSIVCYKVSEEYDKSRDFGVRWDSFGFNWYFNYSPEPRKFIISRRDSNFPPLAGTRPL